ncbi:hypothetical protein I8H83_00240 [Candidatus Saccharibacteria bacterium]|nr:hypothetical protein [Candidatus Saccharibacteria bacterium]MBH2007019.1 hypothetical protein [Candidatus Saccharibacteria bacterium]
MEGKQPETGVGLDVASMSTDDLLALPDFRMSAEERTDILLEAIRNKENAIRIGKETLDAVISEARSQGVSFSALGDAMQCSPQAVQQQLARREEQNA